MREKTEQRLKINEIRDTCMNTVQWSYNRASLVHRREYGGRTCVRFRTWNRHKSGGAKGGSSARSTQTGHHVEFRTDPPEPILVLMCCVRVPQADNVLMAHAPRGDSMTKKQRKVSKPFPNTASVRGDDEAGTREEFKDDSELVIGLAGAVGTDLSIVTKLLEERLSRAGYTVVHVHIAQTIIDRIVPEKSTPLRAKDKGSPNFELTSFKMTRGTLARKRSKNDAILALGAASRILDHRLKVGNGKPLFAKRHAFIIKSLKHPDEVLQLRDLYHQSFYLIGVHSGKIDQKDFLVETKGMTPKEAETLIERDRKEDVKRHGQRLVDTFHMSDFFVRLGDKPKKLREKIWLFLSLLFANPHCTPEFEEYAMFLAFAASLRSTALQRQVGAVIARNKEVLSTGANDFPLYGGGLEWAESHQDQATQTTGESNLVPDRKIDQNAAIKKKILDDIVASCAKRELVKSKTKIRNVLEASGIMEITEYGREVHAEMEAILCCVRNGISTRGAELYTTTFPCHNCIKHIVAAGITRVVFVEPYLKSKAISLHGDVVAVKGEEQDRRKDAVPIEPYVGVGPRRFFDLYSMRHGSGRMLDRKDKQGRKLEWVPDHCNLRHQMLPHSYLELELKAANMFKQLRRKCLKHKK